MHHLKECLHLLHICDPIDLCVCTAKGKIVKEGQGKVNNDKSSDILTWDLPYYCCTEKGFCEQKDNSYRPSC